MPSTKMPLNGALNLPVLDEDGTFVGFDVVVGNPPYMRVQEIEKSQPSEKVHYQEGL